MNCYIRQYGLGGGAPRSYLQYINILKEQGYGITCIAGPSKEKGLRDIYIKTVDKYIEKPDFNRLLDYKKFFQAYKEVKWECEYVEQHKPDLVIVSGFINAFFYSSVCKNLKIPLIIFIAGGIVDDEFAIKYNHYGHVICFSEENKAVIEKYIQKEKITVIPNRIKIDERFGDIRKHYRINKGTDSLNILIISRLAEEKIKSVIAFLKAVYEYDDLDIHIRIRIAGQGEKENDIKQFLAMNKSENVSVELLGHVDPLIDEYRRAHIIVGKGRSVMEPVMMGRIGCVIGEDGRFEICKEENFNNLYRYNFSGRHLTTHNATKEFHSELYQIINNIYDIDKIEKVSSIIYKTYSADHLGPKVEKVLEKLSVSKEHDFVASSHGWNINKAYLIVLIKTITGKVKRYGKRIFCHS